MDYDRDKVDEMTLALLWLTSFKDPVGCGPGRGRTGIRRSDFTHGASSLIQRAKSVGLSEEGEKLSKELFAKHFALKR